MTRPAGEVQHEGVAAHPLSRSLGRPVARFPHEKLGDVELVEAVKRGGDLAALGVVWDRYSEIVRNVLRGALGADASIEDLLQDVFMALVKGLDTLRDGAKVRSFLISVAVRLAALELRRRKIRRWVTLSPTGAVPEPPVAPRDVEGREALRAFYRILDQLGTRRRMAFVLRHVHELEMFEVAEVLGVSESTAKREVARARGQITRCASLDPALRHYLALAGGVKP